MKNEKMIDIIGMIDDDIIAEADDEEQIHSSFLGNRKAVKTFAAACFALTAAVAAVLIYFVLEINTNFKGDALAKEIRLVAIGKKQAMYEIKKSDYSNRSLNRKGELFTEDENGKIYYVMDRVDLVYLVFEQNGSLNLGKFIGYVIALDGTIYVQEHAYSDIDFGHYKYGSVLSDIYAVSSAADIKDIKLSKTTDRGNDELIVFEQTSADSDIDIAQRFYDMLYYLTCIHEDELHNYEVDGLDEKLLSEIKQKRDPKVHFEWMLTITLNNDEEIIFYYNPLSRLFYQNESRFYEPITDEDHQWFVELMEV